MLPSQSDSRQAMFFLWLFVRPISHYSRTTPPLPPSSTRMAQSRPPAGRPAGAAGAGRVRLEPRGLPRDGAIARLPRPLGGPRGKGPLRLHRVGGVAALEQRQDRPLGHLLLRDEPVAGGGAPAAASGRDLRLGGRRRLLPRSQPPWWHPVHLREGLVPIAGRQGAARPRRAGLPEPDDRRLGVRAPDAR